MLIVWDNGKPYSSRVIYFVELDERLLASVVKVLAEAEPPAHVIGTGHLRLNLKVRRLTLKSFVEELDFACEHRRSCEWWESGCSCFVKELRALAETTT